MVNGSKSATAMLELRPGSAPTNTPKTTPSTITERPMGSTNTEKP